MRLMPRCLPLFLSAHTDIPELPKAMYSKLDPSRKEIRLLQLCPGAWRNEIVCGLLDVSLTDQPCFKALSYVWGDIKHSTPIIVKDQTVTITQNLLEGL
jgi:hypothetical protein